MKRLIVVCFCLMLIGASCKKKDAVDIKVILDIAEIVIDASQDIAEVIPVEEVPEVVTAKKVAKKAVYVAPQSIQDDVDEIVFYEYLVGSWYMEGECLSLIADKVYGDPYLWPLLFEVNADKCPHPALVYEGDVLMIPVLED